MLLGLLGTVWFETLLAGEKLNLPFEIAGTVTHVPLIPEDSINVLLWPFYSLILHGLAIFIGMASVRLIYRIQHGVGPMDWDSDLHATLAWVLAVISTFVICSAFLFGLASIPKDNIPSDPSFALKLACLWALVPTTTAFFAVIYLNATLHQERKSSWRQKAVRSSLQGLLTGLMGFIAVTVFLGFTDYQNANPDTDKNLFYFKVYIVGMTTAVGLLLGYLLPSGYENYLHKNSREKRKEVRQEASTESLPAWIG